MDIILLDAVVPEALSWLESRHSVDYRPELADDLNALRKEAYKTQGIVFPRQTLVTRDFLDFLPELKALGRLHVSTDNTDLQACKERGIKVIHASSANVRSNAEYLLSSLLLLYRRGVVAALMGKRHLSSQMGRELAGSTVGILGLAPTMSCCDLWAKMQMNIYARWKTLQQSIGQTSASTITMTFCCGVSQKWVGTGEYDRILRGEYIRRGTPEADRPVRDHAREAGDYYRDQAREAAQHVTAAAKEAGQTIRDAFRNAQSKSGAP